MVHGLIYHIIPAIWMLLASILIIATRIILDDFLVDDITWNDISGDELFKLINPGLSTSGEQYLYYLLRSPVLKQEEYKKRADLIEMMEKDAVLRTKLQMIFLNLGRRRAANTSEVFRPSSYSSWKLIFYLLHLLALFGSIVGLFFSASLVPVLVGLIVFSAIFHSFATKRIESDLATVNYSVSMVFAAKKIRKIASPDLNENLASCYEALSRMKSISRIGSVPLKSGTGEIVEFFNSILLLDLIIYELLKKRLGKHHEDIFRVHEHLGRLDSAIAIASYRKSLETYSVPQIDFSLPADIYIKATDLMHPLIELAVPNNLDTSKSVLLTGSNASGKSTFLRTVAINAIFAQGICTVIAKQYSAPAFKIYSSMAITDNLLAEESYFISEIKSLKRIMDADNSQQPLLCIIDEVLRGTNTIERIAASSELLMQIASENNLCIAATHDIELCSMLGEQYNMLHFKETVTSDGDVLFDYMIRDGRTTTRNAIKLLRSMGFDKTLVKRANEKADAFMAEGKWSF